MRNVEIAYSRPIPVFPTSKDLHQVVEPLVAQELAAQAGIVDTTFLPKETPDQVVENLIAAASREDERGRSHTQYLGSQALSVWRWSTATNPDGYIALFSGWTEEEQARARGLNTLLRGVPNIELLTTSGSLTTAIGSPDDIRQFLESMTAVVPVREQILVPEAYTKVLTVNDQQVQPRFSITPAMDQLDVADYAERLSRGQTGLYKTEAGLTAYISCWSGGEQPTITAFMMKVGQPFVSQPGPLSPSELQIVEASLNQLKNSLADNEPTA